MADENTRANSTSRDESGTSANSTRRDESGAGANSGSDERGARGSVEIPRPETGDVVELILEDHRLFEELLRELRNEQNDRDALRAQMAELLVAHGEAEEREVYPKLERKNAIGEEEAEHGEKEHQEGYETLLPLLGATELYGEDFSNDLHEFSETLLHHLDEEERDILNPARTEVSAETRASLGAAWLAERNRLLAEGCGSVEQVRALTDAS